jgi:hypothetical protein
MAVYGGVLGWLSLSNIQHGKKLVMLENMSNKLDQIEKNQDKMSERIDIFLKNEIDTLKDIARRE